LTPWIISIFWLAWLMGVIIHGLGGNIWGSRELNFAASGQFGDSFGPLASLMAALAASGAFLTLQQQRDDGRKIQARSDIQDFEQTFFRLLGILIEKTHRIDLRRNKTVKDQVIQEVWSGPDAFRTFTDAVRYPSRTEITDEKLSSLYLNEFRRREADLGHYFRLVYHVLLHVDTTSLLEKSDVRYRYARILRAQLSNPELQMILMNCLFGHGQLRFLPLTIKYDFFQQIGESEDPLSVRLFDILKRHPDGFRTEIAQDA